MKVKTTLSVLWISLLLQAGLKAQEWTRFRGPNGTGRSSATSIPLRWKESDYNWKVKIPGEGHSQPVLWGEKIFLTSAEEKGARRLVLCLRVSDGGEEWLNRYDSETHKKNPRNSYASNTPAVDSERVYVAFSTPASFILFALDHKGKEIWRRDFGPFQAMHGSANSPIVFQDLVILGNDQAGESFLIAVDRKTGETKWKTPRESAKAAYGTPCVYKESSGREALLFTSQAHGISSIDALTGKVNWEARVFDKRTVSSPLLAGGLVFGTCGSGGGGNYLVAVKTGGEGDVTESHVAYKLTRAIPYVPTSVAHEDLIFLWGDRGVVTCVEIPTGTIIWQERVGGEYSGSPVGIGDRIYAISDEGEVVVLSAGREYNVLARNPLGEGSRCTPAIAGGKMYLRTYRHLISVGGKQPSGQNI